LCVWKNIKFWILCFLFVFKQTSTLTNFDQNWHSHWYKQTVITPRGFTSLPTQEAEYIFSGFIPTNKQTNKQHTHGCKYIRLITIIASVQIPTFICKHMQNIICLQDIQPLSFREVAEDTHTHTHTGWDSEISLTQLKMHRLWTSGWLLVLAFEISQCIFSIYICHVYNLTRKRPSRHVSSACA